MSHINDDSCPYRPGRPKDGLESRSVNLKIRIEPYLDAELTRYAKALGVSKSEAVRQGVILWIREAKKLFR